MPISYWDALDSPYAHENVDPGILQALIAAQSQDDTTRLNLAGAAAERAARERLARFQAAQQERLQQMNVQQAERLQGLDAQERLALERLRQAGGAYGAYGGYGRPGGY